MKKSAKKVLYVASTFSHLAAFHQPYTAWFSKQGCDVHAAAGGTPIPLSGISRAIPISFEKKMFSPHNLTAIRQLRRLIRQEQYDLISVHTSLAAFFTRIALMIAGKRNTVLINTVHGYLFDNNTAFLRRALLLGAEKLTAGATDLLLTMNRQDTAIATKHRLGRRILQTDGMGVDLDRFSPPTAEERRAARESFGIPPDRMVLVYAAEFSARKNQRMLIDALPQLPDSCCLLLPGSGALLEDCKSAAAAAGLTDRVFFPGFVQQIEQCYRAADLCVSASRIEGLPFNIAEAMSCGLPAVISDIKGHEDLVISGENGLLYPYNNTAAFCKAVYALQDASQRLRMGSAAADSVKRFGRTAVYPALVRIYADALQSDFSGRTYP